MQTAFSSYLHTRPPSVCARTRVTKTPGGVQLKCNVRGSCVHLVFASAMGWGRFFGCLFVCYLFGVVYVVFRFVLRAFGFLVFRLQSGLLLPAVAVVAIGNRNRQSGFFLIMDVYTNAKKTNKKHQGAWARRSAAQCAMDIGL